MEGIEVIEINSLITKFQAKSGISKINTGVLKNGCFKEKFYRNCNEDTTNSLSVIATQL